MSEQLTVALTPTQRSLIVEGLRYLRSTRRYEFRDPLAPPDSGREQDIREIVGLLGQLNVEATSPVGAQH